MTTSPLPALAAAAASLPLLLLAPTLAVAAPATAASDKTPLDLTPAAPVEQAASSGGGGGIARMVVGLAVVIGVIYGLSWVLKQVRASKEGQATGGGIAPISSLPLGPNRSVHLVRVGHELVLLGVAEKGVTPIRTYDESQARAAGLLADADDAPAVAGVVANPVERLRRLTVRR